MLNSEIVRYIINGVVATLVNYGILNFNILILGMKSAGLANFIATIFGIIVSFIGSRYFVFRKHTDTLSSQAVRFVVLYGFIAVLGGLVLYLWTDVYGLSYHIGFIIATFLQVAFSYLGNKMLVFKA